MSNRASAASETLQTLKLHGFPETMVCRDGKGFQLYAPVHGISMRITRDGTLDFEGVTSTVSRFIEPSDSPVANTLRMYRHAFLKPHKFGSALNIEINRTCSLSCPHCFAVSDTSATGDYFPLEHLDSISHFSPREISLTGGEVFASESYKAVIDRLNSFPDKKNITLRFLSNGTWFQNSEKLNEVTTYLKENCSLKYEFRFTLFDFRSKYHDLLAGSAENFSDLMNTSKFLTSNKIPVSHNYTINSWNFALRDEALQFLAEQWVDSFSLSSILYPTAKTRKTVRELMITPNQFRSLLDEAPFRALASQYCDTSPQCRYHCNFPLLTREGILYQCNLPGTPVTSSSGKTHLPAGAEICKSCKAAHWCKKCPSTVPYFNELYCPFAKIAASVISRDSEALSRKGYSLIGSSDL